jgi:hypothetical protein
MNDTPKPNFAAWRRENIDKFVSELWDDHIKMHEAVEQLRLDNKDLSTLLRKQFMQEDDMK